MSPDDNPTPLSQQAADPIDPTPAPRSWQGPVTALTTRVTKLEEGQTEMRKDLTEVKTETRAQTVLLGEIKGMLVGGAKLISENPWVRRFIYAIAVALAGLVINWLRTHGVIVEFTP